MTSVPQLPKGRGCVRDEPDTSGCITLLIILIIFMGAALVLQALQGLWSLVSSHV